MEHRFAKKNCKIMRKKLFMQITGCILALLKCFHSLTVNRFGYFHKLHGVLPSWNFLVLDISGIDVRVCLKQCMRVEECRTFAYGAKKCVLFSSDPRAEVNESAIIRTTSDNPLTLWVISADFDVPCFIGNIQAFSQNDFNICAIEEKLVAAKAAVGWSNWTYNYESPCGDDARILVSKTRHVICTKALFGGKF